MPKLLGVAALGLVAAGTCCGGDWLPSPDEPPPPGTTAYVTASSLHLRSGASADSPSLTEVPRGAQIIVTGPGERADTAAGLAGQWVPAWFGGQRGYVFDAFVLPVPPPPEGCGTLAHWAETIGYAGPATELGRTTCQQMGISTDGVCDSTTRRSLVGGGFVQTNAGYEWGSDTIHLVGVSRDAVWAAARACFAGPPDLRRQPLPTVAGEVAALAMPEGAVTATVDGTSAGWEYPQGCYAYVRVTQVGADVEISSGGGC